MSGSLTPHPKKRARINSGRVLLCGFVTEVGGLPVSG